MDYATVFKIYDLEAKKFLCPQGKPDFWKSEKAAIAAYNSMVALDKDMCDKPDWDNQQQYVIREYTLEFVKQIPNNDIPKSTKTVPNIVYRIFDTVESTYWYKQKKNKRSPITSVWTRPCDAKMSFNATVLHKPICGIESPLKDQSRFVIHEMKLV